MCACMSAWVYVCVHACVRVRMDACMFRTLLMCLRVYLSGRSWGRWVGRECEWDFYVFILYLLSFLNVPSWAHVSKENFHFYALYYIYINKDSFNWLISNCHTPCIIKIYWLSWQHVNLYPEAIFNSWNVKLHWAKAVIINDLITLKINNSICL